jgi:hypothetical protein
METDVNLAAAARTLMAPIGTPPPIVILPPAPSPPINRSADPERVNSPVRAPGPPIGSGVAPGPAPFFGSTPYVPCHRDHMRRLRNLPPTIISKASAQVRRLQYIQSAAWFKVRYSLINRWRYRTFAQAPWERRPISKSYYSSYGPHHDYVGTRYCPLLPSGKPDPQHVLSHLKIPYFQALLRPLWNALTQGIVTKWRLSQQMHNWDQDSLWSSSPAHCSQAQARVAMDQNDALLIVAAADSASLLAAIIPALRHIQAQEAVTNWNRNFTDYWIGVHLIHIHCRASPMQQPTKASQDICKISGTVASYEDKPTDASFSNGPLQQGLLQPFQPQHYSDRSSGTPSKSTYSGTHSDSDSEGSWETSEDETPLSYDEHRYWQEKHRQRELLQPFQPQHYSDRSSGTPSKSTYSGTHSDRDSEGSWETLEDEPPLSYDEHRYWQEKHRQREQDRKTLRRTQFNRMYPKTQSKQRPSFAPTPSDFSSDALTQDTVKDFKQKVIATATKIVKAHEEYKDFHQADFPATQHTASTGTYSPKLDAPKKHHRKPHQEDTQYGVFDRG